MKLFADIFFKQLLYQYTTTPSSCLQNLKGQTPFVPPRARRSKSWSNK